MKNAGTNIDPKPTSWRLKSNVCECLIQYIPQAKDKRNVRCCFPMALFVHKLSIDSVRGNFVCFSSITDPLLRYGDLNQKRPADSESSDYCDPSLNCSSSVSLSPFPSQHNGNETCKQIQGSDGVKQHAQECFTKLHSTWEVDIAINEHLK